MRLTRARSVLLGLVLWGCFLPDVGLVESFGSGGAAASGSSGANPASGNAPAGAGTTSAGTGASSAGGDADNAAGGAGTDSAGGSDTGTAGGGKSNGGGNGGTDTSGTGGTDVALAPPHPHAWASWPMPNDASAALPNPANYDTATSGVVKDNVTGLMWQRTVPEVMTHEAASAYCSDLTLGGHSDWRLPTRIELISIMDFSVLPPAATIDPVAFPDTPLKDYWTASLYKRNSLRPYVCHFEHGWTSVLRTTDSAAIRCVRP